MKRTTLSVAGRLAAAVILAGSGVGCSRGSSEKAAEAAAPPAVVKVAGVAVKDMPLELRTFGTVEPSASAAIRSQLSGMLTHVLIRDGQEVKAGDLLASLDARPSEAALAQAEANLARSRVQRRNAGLEAERQDQLWSKGLTSQDLRDQAHADAEALAAAVQGDEAAVEKARIQLGYCSIRAPFDGRAGKVLVDAGNVVKADETVLVGINRIHPVYVTFSAPQADLGLLQKRMAEGALPVHAYIPEAPDKPEAGALTFADNAVDKATGTITLHGTFTNGESRLWPGQFVNVVLTLGTQAGAIVIPSVAVQTGQKGMYVFVVKPDLTAETRPVVVDRKRDEESLIASGLAAGERVIIDGQYRLKPGGKVQIERP